MQHTSTRIHLRLASQILVCSLIILSCGINNSLESNNARVDSVDQTATAEQQMIQTVDSFIQTGIAQQQEFNKVFTPVYPSAEIADGGLLSKQPCGPPCFMGLTPDLTTKAEVLEFFKNRVDLNQCHIWDRQKEAGDEGIICNPIEVTFQESGLINYIRFSPSSDLSVKDVLSSYGEPDGVYSVSNGDEEGNILSVHMELFYNHINTKLYLEAQASTSFELNEATPVIQITYLTDAEFDEDLEFTEPWRGFSIYSPMVQLRSGYP